MNVFKCRERWLVKLFFLIVLLLGQTIFNQLQATRSQQESTITVSGKVLDSNGAPLVGVSIVEKGTTNGSITDMDGKYAIKVAPNSTIEVSYIGYITQDVAVAGQKSLSFTMKENTVDLGDVIVVGYGTQKKESLTGAISGVTSEDIKHSAATTASGAIVGKIAGVNSRMMNGQPGKGTSINIRNMGTPLYVIDGIQSTEDQFNNLDFNDIEQLNVLKDASAAIYGVKAANGVVVITTKKGKLGEKNKINVNAYYGIQTLFRFPQPANAATYVSNYIQSETLQGVSSPLYTKDDLTKWQKGTEKGYQPFDWYNYIFDSAPQKYISASTSGGSEKINYYLSASNLNQQSVISNYGGYQRTNVQMSVNAQVSTKFKIGGTFRGRVDHEEHPGVPGGDDLQEAFIASYKNRPTERPFANDNPSYVAKTNGLNFGMMNYNLAGRSQRDKNDFQFSINGEYQIIKALTLKGQVGYHLYNEWYDNQEYTFKEYGYDATTDSYPVVFDMTNPWREREIKKTQEVNTQVQLVYTNKFRENGITGLLAAESYKATTPEFWLHAKPAANAIPLIDYQSMDVFNDKGNRTQARLGYIGKLNYDYSGKYLLELSGRYDGSYQFAPDKRWGFFPSASAGWRISEESFWKDHKVGQIVNSFKVRVSYGMLGDDNLNADGLDNKYQPLDFMSGYNYRDGGAVIDGQYVPGTKNRGVPVTNVSWLKSKIFDAGIDYSLLNGKLNGTLDYFDRRRDGLPGRKYDVLIPDEAGFQAPLENLNSDMEKGMDASLTWKSNVNKFNYTVGGNITYARKLDGSQYRAPFGNSLDDYRNDKNDRYANLNWGYHAIGQFQSWDQIANYKVNNDGKGNTSMRPGDIMYEDVNHDGVINDLDQRPMGYQQGGLPYLSFGLNFTANYKNFDLAIGFAGSSFMSHKQNWEAKIPFRNGGNNPQYYMGNTWHLSDITDANSPLIPGKYPTMLIGNDGSSNYWESDFWINNISYMKLKNFELGYTLPKTLLKKLGIEKIRIYMLGQNLFSLDNVDTGLDPELNEESGMQYPTSRVINLGANLTF